MAVELHTIDHRLLTKQVKILLVGAGGTGSRILERLMCLHKALVAKGHPHGLNVTVADADDVSPANVGRQAFYNCDIGENKACVLVNRINMHLEDVEWDAYPEKITGKERLQDYDIVIGAVDNRAARKAILTGLTNLGYGTRYWLDTGNRRADGQVVLGQVAARATSEEVMRLPHAGELYPELVDVSLEDADDTPSCSLAEALEKQSLFINPTVADFAVNLLWKLFTEGSIDTHGALINLDRVMVMPLRVDPDVWARYGVKRKKPITKPSEKSVGKKKEPQAVPA